MDSYVHYKKQFVDSKTDINESTRNDYLKNLQHFEKFENNPKFSTDLFNFNDDQLFEAIYSMFKGKSPKSVDTIMSSIKQYIEWALKNDLRKDRSDSYKDIIEKVTERLSIENYKNKVKNMLSYEQIVAIAGEYSLKQSSAALLLMFEGVEGKEDCELFKLEKDNIKGNVLSLCTGRKITVTNSTIKILNDVINQKQYTRRVKTKRSISMELKESNYIFTTLLGDKKSSTGKYLINNRLSRILKNHNANSNDIKDSGQCFYLSLIETIKKSRVDTEDYAKVIMRFGNKPTRVSVHTLKNIYEEYRKVHNISINTTSDLIEIYNELITYNVEFMNKKTLSNRFDKAKNGRSEREKRGNFYSEPDPALGKYGKNIIFKYLNTKYEKVADIADETQNGVGYDFDFIDKKTGHYKCIEVKTTRTMNTTFQIYMTINEVKTAAEEGDNNYLYILYCKDKENMHLYIIQNPLLYFGLLEYYTKIKEAHVNECSIVPIQFRINCETKKIGLYEDLNFRC
jgi:hypothetical protein